MKTQGTSNETDGAGERAGALVPIPTPGWAVRTEAVGALQEAALAQPAAIAKMEGMAAMGGVIAGLTLLRVKANPRHGEFLPRLKKIREGRKSRRSSKYALRCIFAERRDRGRRRAFRRPH